MPKVVNSMWFGWKSKEINFSSKIRESFTTYYDLAWKKRNEAIEEKSSASRSMLILCQEHFKVFAHSISNINLHFSWNIFQTKYRTPKMLRETQQSIDFNLSFKLFVIMKFKIILIKYWI